MENSTVSNDTTVSWNSLDFWFNIIGVPYQVEIFYLVLHGPTCLAGFFLNILSHRIFRESEFSGELYSYMRVYTINSALYNLVSGLVIFYFCMRTFPTLNSYLSVSYICFIYIPINTVMYFFGSILDCTVSIDRLATFSRKFRFINMIKPMKMCLIILIGCAIIDIPFFFIYYPSGIKVRISQYQEVFLHFFDITDFAKSYAGQIITNSLYFIREVVTLVIEVILNIISVVLLRRYLSKKKALLRKVPVNQVISAIDGSSLTNNHVSTNVTQSINVKQNNNINEQGNVRNDKRGNIDNVDKKATLMVIVLGVLSALAHCTFICAEVYVVFKVDQIAQALIALAIYCIALKHSSNFFIFYCFNKNFKVRARKFLRLNNN